MSSERVTSTKVGCTMMPEKPTEPEQLPCPRCDSTNTKFCYYNNYNLSQPRHFCKACRRYWTRGGALRNVPIGGGTRRNSSSNKRPRTDNNSSSTSTTTTIISVNSTHDVLNSLPVSEMGHGSGSFVGSGYDVNLNEAMPETGSFSSLLLSGDTNPGSVFWGVPHRYVGSGLYGMGFGLNILDFPVEGEGERDNNSGSGGAGVVVSGGGEVAASSGGSTWQMNDGNNDNFSWPDLAISTPGKSLK